MVGIRGPLCSISPLGGAIVLCLLAGPLRKIGIQATAPIRIYVVHDGENGTALDMERAFYFLSSPIYIYLTVIFPSVGFHSMKMRSNPGNAHVSDNHVEGRAHQENPLRLTAGRGRTPQIFHDRG
jgi:hypothetical protein